MTKGLTISARALELQTERHAIIAENIANAGTAGYKRTRVAFKSFATALDQALGQSTEAQDIVLKERFDDTSGQLQPSGNPCDFALAGPGYFALQDDGGRVYTRNGAFRLDAEGTLVDQSGRPVLGQSGPIRIIGDSWSVSDDGTVTVDDLVVDQLLIVEFPPELATRRGEGIFDVPVAAARVVPDPHVRQGYLESSNVQVVEEMVQLINALRTFEASQRLIQAQDRTLEHAVNEIGRT